MNRSKFIRSSGVVAGSLLLSPHSIFSPSAILNQKIDIPNNLLAMSKLKDVNTTNIEAAISLGFNALTNCFDADDNDIPFFLAFARPDPRHLLSLTYLVKLVFQGSN